MRLSCVVCLAAGAGRLPVHSVDGLSLMHVPCVFAATYASASAVRPCARCDSGHWSHVRNACSCHPCGVGAPCAAGYATHVPLPTGANDRSKRIASIAYTSL